MTLALTFWETVGANLITLALTVFLGLVISLVLTNPISAYWAIRQKRRESQLSATDQFYQLYGEFVGIWKHWQYTPKESGPELLQRACTAEGRVEAILVKLAAERALSKEEQYALGQFRQAYQTIREYIGTGRRITWSDDPSPAYDKFKKLSSCVAHMLAENEWADRRSFMHRLFSPVSPGRPPSVGQVEAALKEITSHKWDFEKWVDA